MTFKEKQVAFLIRKNYILEGGIVKKGTSPTEIIPFTNLTIDTTQTETNPYTIPTEEKVKELIASSGGADPTKTFTDGVGTSSSPSLSRQLFNDQQNGFIFGVDNTNPLIQFRATDTFGKGILAEYSGKSILFAFDTRNNGAVFLSKDGVLIRQDTQPDISKTWQAILAGGSGGATKSQVYAFNKEIFQNGTATTIGADDGQEQIQVNVDLAAVFNEISAGAGLKKEPAGLDDGFSLSLDNPPYIIIRDDVADGAGVFSRITAEDVGKTIYIFNNGTLIGWFDNPDFEGEIVERTDDTITLRGNVTNTNYDYINIVFKNDDQGGTATFANNKMGQGKTLGSEFGATIQDVKDLAGTSSILFPGVRGIINAGTGISVDIDDANSTLTITSTGGSGGDATKEFDSGVKDATTNSRVITSPDGIFKVELTTKNATFPSIKFTDLTTDGDNNYGLLSSGGLIVRSKNTSQGYHSIEITSTDIRYYNTQGGAITALKTWDDVLKPNPRWVNKDATNFTPSNGEKGKLARLAFNQTFFYGRLVNRGFIGDDITNYDAPSKTMTITRLYVSLGATGNWNAADRVALFQVEQYTDPAKPQRQLTNTINPSGQNFVQIEVWE